jgi:hypothetical protein
MFCGIIEKNKILFEEKPCFYAVAVHQKITLNLENYLEKPWGIQKY